jgi:hypothetical protein
MMTLTLPCIILTLSSINTQLSYVFKREKTIPLPNQYCSQKKSCLDDPPSDLQAENHQQGQISLLLLLNHLHKSKVCEYYQLHIKSSAQ